jgi:hypothetical protein
MDKLNFGREGYKVITSLDDVPGDALYFMDETTVESNQGIPRLFGGVEYHKFRSGICLPVIGKLSMLLFV